MPDEIRELLKQSLTAHYRFMITRIPEKQKTTFTKAFCDCMEYLSFIRLSVPSHVDGSVYYNKFIDVFNEISYNIEKRYVTGDSRDFIFEKL